MHSPPSVQRGFINLLVVLVVGAVSLAIVTSLILLGLGFSKSSFALEQSNQAKSLVNACTEIALDLIRQSLVFSGSANISLGQGSCTYSVAIGAGQTRTVTASSTVGTIVRKVSASVNRITPTIQLSSWQEGN